MVSEWKRLGVKRVIVRASSESASKRTIARQQMQVCSDAGLELEAYVWLYWFLDVAVETQVAEALDVCTGYPVRRLWFDCEDQTILDASELGKMIRQAVMRSEVAGMPTGIYSRRTWWTARTSDTKEFAHLPLWDCEPDGDPSLGGFVPYGGWSKRAIKQYTFDAVLAGVQVDLNVYEEEIP